MEDALVRWPVCPQVYQRHRLNPCFNGRCTRTYAVYPTDEYDHYVLILVLMEDALVLNFQVIKEFNADLS